MARAKKRKMSQDPPESPVIGSPSLLKGYDAKSQFLLAHSYFSRSKPQRKRNSTFNQVGGSVDLQNSTPRSREPDFIPSFDKDSITLEQLQAMHDVFRAKKNKALTKHEFVEAMVNVGSNMSREHLGWWFHRVDANNSGGIDWGEFSTFLVTGTVDPEGRVIATTDTHATESDQYFRNRITPADATHPSSHPHSGNNHNDFVTCICVHPKNGRYYTGGMDGTVRVWDAETMELELVLHSTKKKVTGVVLSQDLQQLAVLGVDRSVIVYDLTQLVFRKPRCFCGRKAGDDEPLPPLQTYHVLTPDDIEKYHEAIHGKQLQQKQQQASSGHEKPFDETFEDYQRRLDRLHQLIDPAAKEFSKGLPQYRLEGMEFPALCGISVPFFPDLLVLGTSDGHLMSFPVFNRNTRATHLKPTMDVVPNGIGACISCLEYAPFFRGVFSSSLNGTVSLTSIANSKFVTVASSPHPIFRISWVDSSRQLATIGQSREVSLWSLVNSTFSTVLNGHLAAVTDVCVEHGDKHLITMDAEKVVKVWDLYSLMPVTSFTDRHSYGIANKLSVLCYDAVRNRILTAAWCPIVWSRVTDAQPFTKDGYQGHQRPIVTILYNPLFQQIISVDPEEVRVWEVLNGCLRHVLNLQQIRSSSYTSQVKYTAVTKETIISATFESRYLHLAVGTSFGSVITVSCASGTYIHEYHRQNLPPARLGSDSCALQAIRFGSHRYFGIISDFSILLWREIEEGAPSGVDRVIPITLTQQNFDAICIFQKSEVSSYSKAKWRVPAPTCFTTVDQNIVVGTDCGIGIVYGSSHDALGFVGTYHPNVTVNAIVYNKKNDIVALVRTDGLVCLSSLKRRFRHVLLDHGGSNGILGDGGGTIPALSCIDINERNIVVGDESGNVYIWNLDQFDISTLEQYQTVRLLRSSPPHVCGVSFNTTFVAHNKADITGIVLVDCEGKTTVGTAASDCQVRLFALSGMFVGYVGAAHAWRYHQDQPRMVMKSIPAPLPEAVLVSQSILGSFLPSIGGAKKVITSPSQGGVNPSQLLLRPAPPTIDTSPSLDGIIPPTPRRRAAPPHLTATSRPGVNILNASEHEGTGSKGGGVKFEHEMPEPLNVAALSSAPSMANLKRGASLAQLLPSQSTTLKSSTKKSFRRPGLMKDLSAMDIELRRKSVLESIPSVHHLLPRREEDSGLAQTPIPPPLGTFFGAGDALTPISAVMMKNGVVPRLNLVDLRRAVECSPRSPHAGGGSGGLSPKPQQDLLPPAGTLLPGGDLAPSPHTARLDDWLRQRRVASRTSIVGLGVNAGGDGGGGAQTHRQAIPTIMSRVRLEKLSNLELLQKAPPPRTIEIG